MSSRAVATTFLILLAGLLPTSTRASSGCKFSCPQGYSKKPSGRHPQVNGCGGDGGLDFNPMFPAFTEICNDHDRCYARCGASKDFCDEEFTKQMRNYCESWRKSSGMDFYRDCSSVASLYSVGVQALGCSFYIAAQEQGCTCTRDMSM